MSRANFVVRVGGIAWGTFATRADAVAKATRELVVSFVVEPIDTRVRIARQSVYSSQRAEESWLRKSPSFDLDIGVF